MKNINEKQSYLTKVDDFINYLIQLVNGEHELNHNYYDRSQKKEIDFFKFDDALNKYYWAKENYDFNASILKKIQKLFTLAKTNDEFKSACDNCLLWGAGYKRTSLYTHNMKRINNFPNAKENILDASKILTSDTPDFTEFGGKYWMNAGFTKIYSLINENFIIYDGRVGAALGYIVTLYGQQFPPKTLTKLPKELCFPYGVASESKNTKNPKWRNPSISNSIYQFPKLSSPKNHALWNIRANWILEKVVSKLRLSNPNSIFCTNDGIRKLEAALFMIGYDFPKLNNSNNSERLVPPIKTPRKLSKKERTLEIYKIHKEKTRAQIIELLIKEIKLTKAGASTYYQNCKSTWTYNE